MLSVILILVVWMFFLVWFLFVCFYLGFLNIVMYYLCFVKFIDMYLVYCEKCYFFLVLDDSFLGNFEGCRFCLGRFRSKYCCCVCLVIFFE